MMDKCLLFTVTVILMGQPKEWAIYVGSDKSRRLKFGLEKPVNCRSSD